MFLTTQSTDPTPVAGAGNGLDFVVVSGIIILVLMIISVWKRK